MITLPFTSLPDFSERHSPAEDTRPLEVVILQYLYNPVHRYRSVETFTSLPEKTQKEYKNYPVSIKAGTLYGDAWQYFTRPTSREIPQSRSIPFQWLLTFRVGCC